MGRIITAVINLFCYNDQVADIRGLLSEWVGKRRSIYGMPCKKRIHRTYSPTSYRVASLAVGDPMIV